MYLLYVYMHKKYKVCQMTARCARLARSARQVRLDLARGWAEVGSVCTPIKVLQYYYILK